MPKPLGDHCPYSTWSLKDRAMHEACTKCWADAALKDTL